MRAAAHEGWFARVHGPTMMDTVFTYEYGEDRHVSAFVELVLISRARCMVQVKGGFADAGRWLGNNTQCVRYVGEWATPYPPGKECWSELVDGIGASKSWN